MSMLLIGRNQNDVSFSYLNFLILRGHDTLAIGYEEYLLSAVSMEFVLGSRWECYNSGPEVI